jgi:hypothetical protein
VCRGCPRSAPHAAKVTTARPRGCGASGRRRTPQGHGAGLWWMRPASPVEPHDQGLVQDRARLNPLHKRCVVVRSHGTPPQQLSPVRQGEPCVRQTAGDLATDVQGAALQYRLRAGLAVVDGWG